MSVCPQMQRFHLHDTWPSLSEYSRQECVHKSHRSEARYEPRTQFVGQHIWKHSRNLESSCPKHPGPLVFRHVWCCDPLLVCLLPLSCGQDLHVLLVLLIARKKNKNRFVLLKHGPNYMITEQRRRRKQIRLIKMTFFTHKLNVCFIQLEKPIIKYLYG